MKIYNDDNRLKISFKLNDELFQKQVKPRQLLSDFLRFDCGMTGTHVGCEHVFEVRALNKILLVDY